MVSKDSISGFLYSLVEKGYVDSEMYKLYLKRPNKKNLRNLIESQFRQSEENLKDLVYMILDSWNTQDNIWQDIEILIFRHLIRQLGTATVFDLCKSTEMSANKVRDAVCGLEEEGIVIAFNGYDGNQKLIFLCQDYIKKLLKKHGK
jgi:hypothetical protein